MREVMLPEGFAERITWTRRPARWTPVVVAVSVTAAAVAATLTVSVVLRPEPAAPRPGTVLVAPQPRKLEGRVSVTGLEPGARFLEGESRAHRSAVRERKGRFVWVGGYRLRGAPKRTVWVWVFSGDVTTRDVLADYEAVGETAMRWKPAPAGGWLVGSPQGRDAVLLEPERGLVVVVVTMGVGGERTLRIAEGVRVG